MAELYPLDGQDAESQHDELIIPDGSRPGTSAANDTAANPFASQCMYASKGDWDRQRSLIEDLYLGQGKKLKEVMRIMASEHLFVAT